MPARMCSATSNSARPLNCQTAGGSDSHIRPVRHRCERRLGSDDAYEGNAAASLGSIWGTALVGDVSGVVREQTRRLRGVGNGLLAFDKFLGERMDHAGAYVGRFGPWAASIVVDEKADVDVGAMFQRR